LVINMAMFVVELAAGQAGALGITVGTRAAIETKGNRLP
jgi:uncharacterized membrane protein (UPF0127 family)